MFPWSILGIPPGSDSRTIRRAYARLLKQIDQETEPEKFQRLREAYEAARSGSREAPSPASPPPRPPVVSTTERAPGPRAPDSDGATSPPDGDPIAIDGILFDPETGLPDFPAPPGTETERPSGPTRPNRAPEPEGPPIAVVVSDWMAKILGALEDSGEGGAVEALEELRTSGALDRIQLREKLEEDLLYRLAAEGDVPWWVLAKARSVFGWKYGTGHLVELLGPVEGRRILERLADLEEWERLHGLAARGNEPARVLTGRYEPLRFFRMGLSEERFRAVADEVVRLDALHPNALGSIADSRVAAWWRKRAERPRVFGRDVWLGLVLGWFFGTFSEPWILGFLGGLGLAFAGSFALQMLKAREDDTFNRYYTWPLFWVAWLFALPWEVPYALFVLPALYAFFFSVGVLRHRMGTYWYWSVLPALVFAGMALSVFAPWERGISWAPGLVFLVCFASGPADGLRLPPLARWGWLPAALALGGWVLLGDDASPHLAWGLLVVLVWQLVAVAWGREGARWWIPLPLVPVVLLAAGFAPGPAEAWSSALAAGDVTIRARLTLAFVGVFSLIAGGWAVWGSKVED